MGGRAPNRDAWGKALGWQFLLFLQAFLALVYGTALGAAGYGAFYVLELISRRAGTGDIIKFFGALKEVAFIVILLAYSGVEIAHLFHMARDSRGEDDKGPEDPR